MAFVLSNRRFQLAFFLFVVIATQRFCMAGVFSSITSMEELFETEAILIHNLEAYAVAHEAKLNSLKRRISEFQREHNKASEDISKYISNPINAFLLTKRLTSDWKILESRISSTGSELMENVTMHQNTTIFPTDEDLTGAVLGLIRLQKTYNLDTASIARGEINGEKYSSPMTAHDCFEVGLQSSRNGDHDYAFQWMSESMARLNNDSNEIMNVRKIDILDYLSFSAFKQGNIQLALDFTNELLELSPNEERFIENKVFYENELVNKTIHVDDHPVSPHEKDMEIYEKLCRGEVLNPPKVIAQLKCRYVTNKSAFLTIAPLKLEEAYLEPYIVIYHDVIYDREIEEIKRLAKPRFVDSSVGTPKYSEVSNVRVSKTGWLNDEDHEIIRTIGQRVEDMTGLTVKSADSLQVLNYGIGGHYEPHTDFFHENANKDTGDRIATVLFYMSDVVHGGATVFPRINVTVSAEKGSAALWYNLYKSGEPDYKTMHAGCPVLVGSKWVCNKWLYELGQEFLRPCGLEPDHPE